MMRWLPLVMLVTWIVLVRVRMRIQVRKFGREPVHAGGDAGLRLRERAGVWGLALQFVIAMLVGLGRCDLAASPVQRTIGLVVGFGSALLMFAAQMNMGPSWRIGIDPEARTPLVTQGLYRFSRNPIYVFVLATFAGFALLVPNVVTWLVVVGSLWGFRAQVLREERWLVETYGDEWRSYASRVGRFVPWLGRLPSV
jgi:protein-S-isoprenylcysteine O-methyltransferase Ste14